VILDNGAYEGELVTPSELLRVASELKPSVLTVPDKINDARESERMARDFLTYTIDFPLMRVLQHESRYPEDWEHLSRTLETNYTWLAFPRILGDFRLLAIKAATEPYRNGEHSYIHAFGWTGNLNEVRALAKLGVTSIDTSAPVWRGLHNYKILDIIDQVWETQSGTPFDPNDGEAFEYLPADIANLIESNLQSMQRACVAF
jgi:hypothetical protein